MHKVYVYGSDGVGWSIDSDYYNTYSLLNEIPSIKLVNKFLFANTVYFVWYQQAIKYFRLLKFLRKRIIVAVTNDIREHQVDFEQLRDWVDVWVCANDVQLSYIKDKGLTVYKHPYYVDETSFCPLTLDKEQICNQLNINIKNIRGKFLIGSFQRDSLGNDLSKPKWQKNPNLLIDILSKVTSQNILFVVAGPRRHWIINEAKKLSIPYIFVGESPNDKDDIYQNNLNKTTINLLYNLCDLYIVSSMSEGGPKAIIEASLCQLPLISTDVGFTKDFLVEEAMYNNADDGAKLVKYYINNKDKLSQMGISNYNNTIIINNRAAAIKRLENILI